MFFSLMKVNVHRRLASPSATNILAWGKIVIVTGSTQVLVQILGLSSGIFIIRFLSAKEYALYTLANTILGTMLILADGGISTGVLSKGGQVWQDREKLGTVLATGLDLRKRFAVASSMVAVPVLLYMLHHHGASWSTSLLITIAIIPAFVASLSGALLEIAPRLHQDIIPLQRSLIVANICKLLLLLISVAFFPFAFLAIIVSGIPQLFYNQRIKLVSKAYVDWQQLPNKLVREEVLLFVKRIMPGSIYFCLSGQVTFWLISLFGSTNNIAEIGALGRLSMVLSVFGVLFTTLVVPRFARLPSNRALLLSRYIQIQISCVAITALCVGIVWLFPSQVLWILGEKYGSLQEEVVLSILGSCLMLMAGASLSIGNCRGWIIHPLVSITIAVASIIVGLFIFNVKSIKGILCLNIFIALVELIMLFTYILIKLRNLATIEIDEEVI